MKIMNDVVYIEIVRN